MKREGERVKCDLFLVSVRSIESIDEVEKDSPRRIFFTLHDVHLKVRSSRLSPYHHIFYVHEPSRFALLSTKDKSSMFDLIVLQILCFSVEGKKITLKEFNRSYLSLTGLTEPTIIIIEPNLDTSPTNKNAIFGWKNIDKRLLVRSIDRRENDTNSVERWQRRSKI
jgi:hypothetical protein